MRTFFIGDVHGCIAELNDLLSKIDIKDTDRIVFLGDIINRGPDSLAVLEKVESLKAEVIAGNHELGFLQYVKAGNYQPGSFESVREQLGSSLAKWTDWMRTFPLFIEGEDWFAVHAGVPPGMAPAETSSGIITRIRTWDGVGIDLKAKGNPTWHSLYSGEKTIIYGHWASQGLHMKAKTLGIDTGCVWGGKLTALMWAAEPSDRRVIQVDARKSYCKIPGTS